MVECTFVRDRCKHAAGALKNVLPSAIPPVVTAKIGGQLKNNLYQTTYWNVRRLRYHALPLCFLCLGIFGYLGISAESLLP